MWALSPIGGQASLRQMSIETAMIRSDSLFQYVVPLRTIDRSFFFEKYMPRKMTDRYLTAMTAASSTKASPVDMWGNIKIPQIEHYEKTAEPDNNGWFNSMLTTDDMAASTSFVGIPINGAQYETAAADYDFRMQTEYLHLACNSIEHPKFSDYDDLIGLPPDAYNISNQDGVLWWSENDATNRSEKALERLEPFNFSYTARPSENQFYGTITCSIRNTYVEVEVSCALNSVCRAKKVRRSQLPQLPPEFTFLDLVDVKEYNQGSSFMHGFMQSIGGTKFEPIGYIDCILNGYLTDPLLKNETSKITRSEWPIKISDELLSDRFGRLLNSYWACYYGYFTTTGGINDDTSYFWDKKITFEPPTRNMSWINIDNYPYPYPSGLYLANMEKSLRSKVWSSWGNKYEYLEVIKAHKLWAITLSIISLVLIAFSLVPPLVRHFLAAGPDIAMNFSSLATRNNTHVPIPADGSFLPASDRFRLLKDLRLRFADAESKSDVGHLVIAAQGVEKAEYSRVRKGRLYE